MCAFSTHHPALSLLRQYVLPNEQEDSRQPSLFYFSKLISRATAWNPEILEMQDCGRVDIILAGVVLLFRVDDWVL